MLRRRPGFRLRPWTGGGGRTSGSPGFEAALERASSKIELLAWERAVTGIEEPVYAYGKFSHIRVKRSDAVFRMLLIASNPKKYGRMEAVAQQGKAPKGPSDAEIREALMRKLDAMGNRLRGT